MIIYRFAMSARRGATAFRKVLAREVLGQTVDLLAQLLDLLVRIGDRNPVSSTIWSSSSSKEKTSKLDSMRSGVTDFGMTMVPFCRCQRRTT